MAYRQLTHGQRYMIYALKQEGCNQSKIAQAVGVHKSTISRELRRNVRMLGYRPAMAQRLAMSRRCLARRPKVLTARARKQIRSYLRKKWSPEQISGWLRVGRKFSVSHETIYKYIKEDKDKGGGLYKHLRRQRRYRNHRFGVTRGVIHGRVSIDERPAIVDQKTRIGDWEIDTVSSSAGTSALVTVVERVSKYCAIGWIPDRTQRTVSKHISALLKPFKQYVLTITSDNGIEFASHKYIAHKLAADFYFAHPYKSWERGLNENTNGLIRQYLPKGTSFEKLSSKEIFKITQELNHRPRKTLEFRTPVDVLYNFVALGG